MTDDALAIPTPQNLQLYALDPGQLAAAQAELVAWAAGRVRAVTAELEEQGRALDEAARHPFSNQQAQWRREINKTQKTIAFYEKLHAALAAGYIIVPDFPINVFAIRIEDDYVPTGRGYTLRGYRQYGFIYAAKGLPAGEGRNVSPRAAEAHKDVTNAKNEEKREWWPTAFRDVALPARLVRPEILDATGKALALKVFDEVGMVGGPKGDPIIVGKVIDPRDRYHQRKVAFFVVWWLDTATL